MSRRQLLLASTDVQPDVEPSLESSTGAAFVADPEYLQSQYRDVAACNYIPVTQIPVTQRLIDLGVDVRMTVDAGHPGRGAMVVLWSDMMQTPQRRLRRLAVLDKFNQLVFERGFRSRRAETWTLPYVVVYPVQAFLSGGGLIVGELWNNGRIELGGQPFETGAQLEPTLERLPAEISARFRQSHRGKYFTASRPLPLPSSVLGQVAAPGCEDPQCYAQIFPDVRVTFLSASKLELQVEVRYGDLPKPGASRLGGNPELDWVKSLLVLDPTSRPLFYELRPRRGENAAALQFRCAIGGAEVQPAGWASYMRSPFVDVLSEHAEHGFFRTRVWLEV